MDYFSIKRPIFIVPSEKCNVEFEKIDKFMVLLEKSGVGKFLKYVKYNDKNCKGRKGYNLFATIIYCFAKFNATLRDFEFLLFTKKTSNININYRFLITYIYIFFIFANFRIFTPRQNQHSLKCHFFSI